MKKNHPSCQIPTMGANAEGGGEFRGGGRESEEKSLKRAPKRIPKCLWEKNPEGGLISDRGEARQEKKARLVLGRKRKLEQEEVNPGFDLSGGDPSVLQGGGKLSERVIGGESALLKQTLSLRKTSLKEGSKSQGNVWKNVGSCERASGVSLTPKGGILLFLGLEGEKEGGREENCT